jgi:hypothetical protein
VTAGAGSATFRVPQLPAPDAGALLGRVLQRMHDLRTFRLDETLMPARAPLSVTYAFQAPDRLSYQVSGGGQTVIVGSTQYTRDGPAAAWRAETLPPVPVPSFVWDGSPTVAPHVLGDGVVSFFEDQEGVPVWFQVSVDGQNLVEHASMRAQAHFMTHRYYDFDAPLTIDPP